MEEYNGVNHHCVQMVVHDKPVSMSLTDFWLNATEIATLAGQSTNRRAVTFRKLQKQTQLQIRTRSNAWPYNRSTWISFPYGELLCRKLNLHLTLKPLLDYGRDDQSMGSANLVMESYTLVQYGSNTVAIYLADFSINKSNILRAAGIRRDLWQTYTIGGPGRVVKGGDAKYQGTYIQSDAAFELCRDVRLNDLEKLLQEKYNKEYCGQANIPRDDSQAQLSIAVSESRSSERFSQGSSLPCSQVNGPHPLQLSLKKTKLDITNTEADLNTSGSYHSLPQAEGNPDISFKDGGVKTGTPVLENRSFFTEPSYSNGSFLPRMGKSFLSPVRPEANRESESETRGRLCSPSLKISDGKGNARSALTNLEDYGSGDILWEHVGGFSSQEIEADSAEHEQWIPQTLY